MIISGKRFNEEYENVHFVKLTFDGSYYHNYVDGLNVESKPFNMIPDTVEGGFYFCKFDNFEMFVRSKIQSKVRKYIWDVKNPDDAMIVKVRNMFKCDKFILANKQDIWKNVELCKKIVGFDLKLTNNV